MKQQKRQIKKKKEADRKVDEILARYLAEVRASKNAK